MASTFTTTRKLITGEEIKHIDEKHQLLHECTHQVANEAGLGFTVDEMTHDGLRSGWQYVALV